MERARNYEFNGGGWTNHKLTRGTWRLSKGSVQGAGGQISVQGSRKGQYKAHVADTWIYMACHVATRPTVDPIVDRRSTTVDRWLTGGPAVVNGGVPPLTIVDRRRWPPLTGGPVVAPVWQWQLRGCRLSGGSVLGTKFRWQGGSEIIG
ncbi:hypothetical protein Tco_0435739 [Tanacetum coccineum]